MKNLLITSFVFAALFMVSCGSDDPACSRTAFDLRVAANDVLKAAYDADPSVANCEAYENDLQELTSDFDDCEDTTIEAEVEALDAIKDALDCN